MGKIFYDMGFLAQAKVEECSATDMIGQYVGQTGPKVQKLLEKAMGKVLFIDEAYRLANGSFATEAMDELVDCLTKPKFAQKLVVILAGYDADMDRLISVNPGLSSRFPESVMFKHLSPESCLELLIKVLSISKEKKKAPLNLTVLTPPSTDLERKMLTLFEQLSSLQSWGNARDVKSLANSMFGALISQATPPIRELLLTESVIIEAMESMFDERARRAESAGSSHNLLQPPLQMPPPQQYQKPPNAQTPAITTKASTSPSAPQTTQPKSPPQPVAPVKSAQDSQRDAGVSDAIWQQLESDKRAATALARYHQRLQQEQAKAEKRIEDLKRAEQEAKDDEEKRRREKERIEAELERRRKEELYAAMEREKEKERKAQAKIRELGICVAGFQWIKQANGYRCAGGAHFLSDAQLGF
jgi:hypothetical protein